HSSLSGTIEHPALFVNALLYPLTQFIPRQRGSGSQRASYVVKAFLPGRHLATSLLTWGVRSLIDLDIRRKFNSLFSKHSSPYKSIAYSSSRSEEHTSELQSRENLVCRLLLETTKH